MDLACSSSPQRQPQEGINTSLKGDHTGTSWDGCTTGQFIADAPDALVQDFVK